MLAAGQGIRVAHCSSRIGGDVKGMRKSKQAEDLGPALLSHGSAATLFASCRRRTISCYGYKNKMSHSHASYST
jgi:hypothetical protein